MATENPFEAPAVPAVAEVNLPCASTTIADGYA